VSTQLLVQYNQISRKFNGLGCVEAPGHTGKASIPNQLVELYFEFQLRGTIEVERLPESAP
jgi:hypothetical protein